MKLVAKSREEVRRLIASILGLLVLLVTASLAIAQLPSASILGVVKDSTGAVVPGATLTAHGVETGLTRTAVSGPDGSYRFSALPVGTYEIRAEQSGFHTEVRSGLTLTIAQEAVVDFTLGVGAMEQAVSVTAEAPLVNTTSGSLGGLVNEERVADLPLNGRNYINLSLMQTGIVQNRNVNSSVYLVGVFFSSNGAPVHSNNYLLDGAIMQSFAGFNAASTSGSTLGVDGIREYRVITNSFSAEYGLAMGSQMLIVSKGGTNAFHGSGFEFLRNSALDARNFFDYTSPNRLPPFKRNNFGGSFGGPIKKDRTFFFGVYEGVRERLGTTTIDNVIPVADKVDGGLVPQIAPVIKPLLTLFPDPNLPNNRFTYPFTQPTTEDYSQIRVDHTFSNNDSMFGQFTFDNTDQHQPFFFPQWVLPRHSRNQYATLSENHIFSPTLLNAARFSFSRTTLTLFSPSGIIGPQFSFVPGQEVGIISIGGVTTLGPNSVAPNGKVQNIFTWSDDLFYTRDRHSLKFGTLINRFRQYSLNGTNSKGTISFPNITSFLLAQPSSVTAVTPGAIDNRTYDYSTLGFYAQDDWKATSRLTLNLGLRYEIQTQFREEKGREAALRDVQHDTQTTVGPSALNPSLHNFSPRFGFAWDLMGNGRTALRGGFGLLYDIGNLGSELSAGVLATPPFSNSSSVANPGTLILPLTFPPSASGKALRLLDYHVNQPHMLQFNLSLERQLPFGMALTLAYAGSRGFNIVEVEDANSVIPTILPDNRQFWPANAPRVNPAWTSIEFYTTGSRSWYNSLQVGLQKRLSKGLQFQTAYTWSKTMDVSQAESSSSSTSNSNWLMSTLHPQLDRSLASFDTPQNLRFNLIYRLPQSTSFGRGIGKLLNGWWMSGILSLQSGSPISAVIQTSRSRSNVGGGVAGVDRPDLVPGRNNGNIVSGTTAGCPGVRAGQKLGSPNLYYDPCAFTLQPPGFLGTAGRDILRGPGLANLDYSLVKDTAFPFLGESGKLEFRAEIFNILNRANFNIPSRTVFAGALANATEPVVANAGTITSTLATSRQIQLALKLVF